MADGNPTLKLSEKWIARFWARVDRSGGPDACWPWTGCVDDDGYGKGVYFLGGKRPAAHRVAFFLANGQLPMPCGLHSCDNRACCNPSHVRPGTNVGNTADRHAKGRDAKGDRNGSRCRPERLARGLRNGKHTKPESTPRGERHGMSKITEQKARGILAACNESSLPRWAIALEFGVNIHTVHEIGMRRSWRHL